MRSLQSLATNPDDYEIAGTLRPGLDEAHQIERIVFGGVIRGDRKTGRLSESRIRLSQTTVIITDPQNAPQWRR